MCVVCVKFCVIALIIGIMLGVIVSCISHCIRLKKKLSEIIDETFVVIQKLWYSILLAGTTIYVICKYPECTEFTFFKSFNGDNLVFVVYIILLILPLFDKLELFGVNVKLRWQNQYAEQVAKNASDTRNILNKDELSTLNDTKKGGSNE